MLANRYLHGFKPAEWDGLTVSAGGKKRELVQTNPDRVDYQYGLYAERRNVVNVECGGFGPRKSDCERRGGLRVAMSGR